MALSLVNGCDRGPDTSTLDGGGDAAGGRVREAGRPDGSAADLGSAGGRGDASAGPDGGEACDIRGNWELVFEPEPRVFPLFLSITGELGAEATTYFDGLPNECECPSPMFVFDRAACSVEVVGWTSGIDPDVGECLANKDTLRLSFTVTGLGLVGAGTAALLSGQECEPTEGRMDWTVTAHRAEEP